MKYHKLERSICVNCIRYKSLRVLPYVCIVNAYGGRETLALSLFLVEGRGSLDTTWLILQMPTPRKFVSTFAV